MKKKKIEEKTNEELLKEIPDTEGETFRAWTEKNSPYEPVSKDDAYMINYKGCEFGLTGFAKVCEKDTNKVLFLYKFADRVDNKDRMRKKSFIYFIVEETPEILEKFNQVLLLFREIVKDMPIINVKDSLEELVYETRKGTFDKKE